MFSQFHFDLELSYLYLSNIVGWNLTNQGTSKVKILLLNSSTALLIVIQ